MPNQSAKICVAQNDKNQSYSELFKEAIRCSSIHESEKEIASGSWSTDNNDLTKLKISNSLQIKNMNPQFLPEKFYISILDGGV
jgi:hypothetical protein